MEMPKKLSEYNISSEVHEAIGYTDKQYAIIKTAPGVEDQYTEVEFSDYAPPSAANWAEGAGRNVLIVEVMSDKVTYDTHDFRE